MPPIAQAGEKERHVGKVGVCGWGEAKQTMVCLWGIDILAFDYHLSVCKDEFNSSRIKEELMVTGCLGAKLTSGTGRTHVSTGQLPHVCGGCIICVCRWISSVLQGR